METVWTSRLRFRLQYVGGVVLALNAPRSGTTSPIRFRAVFTTPVRRDWGPVAEPLWLRGFLAGLLSRLRPQSDVLRTYGWVGISQTGARTSGLMLCHYMNK
jgi:hypothetical protein